MGKMNDAMALEIADNWDQMAATEANSSPQRRATLRECADLLRMLADLGPPIPVAPAGAAGAAKPALLAVVGKLMKGLEDAAHEVGADREATAAQHAHQKIIVDHCVPIWERVGMTLYDGVWAFADEDGDFPPAKLATLQAEASAPVVTEGAGLDLPSPCYLMSEPHLSGHRVIMGYETLEQSMDAQTALAKHFKRAAR